MFGSIRGDGTISIDFFLVSPDTFVMLRYAVFTSIAQPSDPISPRVYAITRKNRILVVYLGTLALARLIISIASTFTKHPKAIGLYPYPIDVSNLCVIVTSRRFISIQNSIGAAFSMELRPFQFLA